MTLVIVGHNFEEGLDEGSLDASGLFAVADSSISMPTQSGNKTILGGFKKIYPMPIKIWKPHFTGVHFHSYLEIYFESQCFIAIAGSTLTAQHVLNSISEHLGNIRISFKHSPHYDTPGTYTIQRHCQKNVMYDNGYTWAENMFTSRDFEGVITGDAILQIIEYSINEALSSAKGYKLSDPELRQMSCEFAVGIYCPAQETHKLHVFRMKDRINLEGLVEVYTEKTVVQEGSIAVLGMREKYEGRAQSYIEELLGLSIPPAKKMFEFLNDAIRETIKSEGPLIDHPSVLKVFNQGSMKISELRKKKSCD